MTFLTLYLFYNCLLNNILIYSNSIEQHFEHPTQFYRIAKTNSIVLSKRKMNPVQTKIGYLGHEIERGYIYPI